MAVNKNFVVKNGIEVATDLIYGTSTLNKVGIGSTIPASTLDVRGGIAATDITASGYIEVTGTATFSDSATIAGVTTLASSGGITTTGGDLYVGGDHYVLDDISYDEVTGKNLNITGVATIAELEVSGNTVLTGVTTLGGGGGITTTGGDFYVGGDLYVLDDITYDEVTGVNLNITGVATIASLGVTGIATVGTALTSYGTLDVDGDTQLDDLNVAGVSTFSALVDANAGADVIGGLTADNINVTGVLTAATLHGGSIGLSSEGTYIGAGATQVNFASSNSTAWTVTEPSSGVATVTVTPGASIGLVLALS